MNVDISKEFTHLSLCSGYGGIDLGLQRTFRAVRTVCYVEIEAFVIENLAKKIEAGHLDCAPIWSDLKTLPWGLFSERVDILSGGFPCQPFSFSGRRNGDSDPRHLWPHILTGIKQLRRPPIIFLENVAGILSCKLKGSDWSDPEGTPVLQHVLRELERVGYKAEAGIFSAFEVGAPHERKRIFILAIRADLKPSGYELIRGELRSDEPSTIYPAGKGKEQYTWEPLRIVNMGNTNSRHKKSRIKQYRVLQEKTNKKQTDRTSGAGDADTSREKVDNTHFTRLERSLFKGITGGEATRPATGSSTSKHIQRPLKSSMGRDINGAARRVGDEELYTSCDNRTDELRMLGNGVVPDTAARAFRVLFNRLAAT